MTAVISLDTQTFLGHNQETYNNLRMALQLNLRRQLLLAVCDDAALQMRLAQRLEVDLSTSRGDGGYRSLTSANRAIPSPMVTLFLDPEHPDPVRQVLIWLKQRRLLKASAQTIPAFQILGLEQLTSRSPTLQNQFLSSLTYVDALITRLDCRLLIWVPRPWIGKIQQAVPGFWRSRSGLFEFAGDPTPPRQGPISFNISTARKLSSSGQASSSDKKLSGSSVQLPQVGKVSQSLPRPRTQDAKAPLPQQNQNLWTILREDLSAFEQEPSAPELNAPQKATFPRAKTSLPFPQDPTLPVEPTASPKPAPSPEPSLTARQPFTVVTDDPMETVVMPPPATAKVDPSNDTAAAEQLEPGHSSPPASVLPSAPSGLATPSQPDTQDQTVRLLPPSTAGLPPELAADSEVVELWQYAQTVAAQQAGPLTVSRVYLGLGQLCRDHIEAGQTSQSLIDFAIDVYRQAIPGLLEGDENWCDALNDMASLYWLRSQQEAGSEAVINWLQLSVEAYRKALKGSQQYENSETLLRICSNLGTVYSLLAGLSEPLVNLHHSQKAYEQALQQLSVQAAPVEYANLQNSLGAVHWRLAQLAEQPQPHLHQAIEAYTEALRHRDPQRAALDYAMIQNNLGIAYWSLAQHEPPRQLLEKAIEAYQEALHHRTLEQSPHGCAATNNNLGTAFWDLAQQYRRNPDQRLTYLQQAVVAYEHALNAAAVALQAEPDLSLGFDIWATLHSAGVVHDQIAQALPVDQANQRKRHLQQALHNYLLAYQGWQDNPQQIEVLVSALVYNVHLSFEILGLPGQQAVLAQVPGELLPDILRQL